MTESWKRAKHIGRMLLGRQPAGRHLTVYPDDVFLTSYPRSGNAWTRFLVGNLIYSEPVTFANVEDRLPEIYLHSNRELLRLSRPRVLKSHEYFDPRYRKIIYIVRDPRDVMVSMYHYSMKRGEVPDKYPIEEFVRLGLAGEFFEDWATWEEHVNSWRATRSTRSVFLFLRYEDMLADPERELEKVAEFMNIDPTPERLARAVKFSGADHMRNLEKQQSRQWKLTKKTRQDIPFVREARSGGWKDQLSEAAVESIEQAWGATMRQLGYHLASRSMEAMQQTTVI